jgi:hypothetical protein
MLCLSCGDPKSPGPFSVPFFVTTLRQQLSWLISICLFTGSEVPFLSIPLADVQRLSICPFKWLRFVLFAICGTAGELSATPDGKPVDYHSTELGVDAIYYFKPSGNLSRCM